VGQRHHHRSEGGRGGLLGKLLIGRTGSTLAPVALGAASFGLCAQYVGLGRWPSAAETWRFADLFQSWSRLCLVCMRSAGSPTPSTLRTARFAATSWDLVQTRESIGTGTWIRKPDRSGQHRPGGRSWDAFVMLPAGRERRLTFCQEGLRDATRQASFAPAGRANRPDPGGFRATCRRPVLAFGASIYGSLLYGDLPAPDGAKTTDIAEALV